MFDLCGMARLFKSQRPRLDTQPTRLATPPGSPLSDTYDEKKVGTRVEVTPRASCPAPSIRSEKSVNRPLARAAGRAPQKPRTASLQAPDTAHSPRSSVHSHHTTVSVADTVYSTLSLSDTLRSAQTQRTARRKAQVLPVPKAIRIEQYSGVVQYGAYMPLTGQTTYTEFATIDGERHGRIGSEYVRPALNDDDLLMFADVTASLEPAQDPQAMEELRLHAERLRREYAYQVIRDEFPEAYDSATIREGGRVQVYEPQHLRERSRSRDQKRRKHFVKLATPPVPALPADRGRQMRARCVTPTFYSVFNETSDAGSLA